MTAQAHDTARSADRDRIWSPPDTALPHTPSVPAAKTAAAVAKPHLPYATPAQWTGPAGSPQAATGTSGAARVTVPDAAAGKPDAGAARAGTLPVWVSHGGGATAGKDARPDAAGTSAAPASGFPVAVTVAPRDTAAAAGLQGPVVSVSRGTAGPAALVGIGLDVSALDAAFGGNAAARSRLVLLPACALTTPDADGCKQRTPVPSHLDQATHRLTADVTVPSAANSATTSSALQAPSVVMAAEPTAGGGDGTYAATNLSPSAAWAAGTSSGGLTYSYPLTLPPAIGGDVPDVALSYDSSSVDGRTSSTNAQSSWIGDGWEYAPGYVERTFTSCDDEGITHSGDLCWGGYNATLYLGGGSQDLVRDDHAKDTWRLKSDDGSKVEFLTGAHNGSSTGEYVKLSTGSGSVYYFGLNHLPGGDGTDPATNSNWTEPVYAPHDGDPCHDDAKGDDSWCQTTWRFNLDYAVDPHGNLTTYSYKAETNKYSRGAGQNGGKGTATSYVRGGSLTTIAYGQRLDDQVAAKGALKAAARVVFTPGDDGRCSTAGGFTCTGATLAKDNAGHWPDVPFDQNCTGDTCDTWGPTFWSNTRLASITTQVVSGGGYKDVDSYALSQSFPSTGTAEKPTMWLDSIQRTGKDGTPAVTLPKVVFTPAMLPNRVDGTDLVPAPAIFNRPRIQSITTETGESIVVDYGQPTCSRVSGHMPSSAAADTMPCYNVKWYPPGTVYGADPASDWFNHYQVLSVTENDLAAKTTAKVTHYTYGPAAWHYDDNEFADAKTRTWDQFRGFASVTATTGNGQDGPVGQTVTRFLQGMDQDRSASGGKRSVTVKDSLGDSVTDSDWLAGQTLEKDTYDKAGGAVTAYSVTTATGPHTTATHARGSDLPDLVARYNATSTTTTAKARKADGSWQTTSTTTSTDPDHGNRTTTVATRADGQPDQCARTSYATGSDALMTLLADQAVTVSGADACTATPTAGNTVSYTRTLYDGKAFGTAGDAGNATAAQVLDHFDAAGAPVLTTTATTTYDDYGRAVTATDPTATDAQHPGGSASTTTYTTAHAGELPSGIAVRTSAPGTAADWTTSATLDLARGQELVTTDANGRTTTQQYDALGRLSKVWEPGEATDKAASSTFSYAVNGTAGPSATTTSTLTSDTPHYNVSVQIFDGFGRERQTQETPGISAYHGRIVTDTYYDSQGRTLNVNSPYYNGDAAPGTTLLPSDAKNVPGQTSTLYDGQGRTTATVFSSYAVEQWRTGYAYPGVDETDTTPPAGGTATTTLTDSLGRTSQVWQYRTPAPTGKAADADVTTYTYTPAGNPESMTDATGKNTWTYGYDLRGRQTTATDPDTGTTTQTYDAAGNLATVTDARKGTLSMDYDLLGRRTAQYSIKAGSTAKVPEAAWTYDTLPGAKGQPVASIAYTNGDTANPYRSEVTGYDTGYRPTGTKDTIPATEGKLAGTYVTKAAYDPITGALTASQTDARGDLPAETVTYKYDVDGPLLSYGSQSTEYDLSTDYDAFGRPTRTTVNPWGTEVVATDDYDLATGALVSSFLDKQTAQNGAVQQTDYTRNAAGRVTSVRDIADNTPALTDLQCFGYDHLGRLTTAWTDTGGTTVKPQPSVKGIGGCTNATPTSGAPAGSTTVGGPNPYWTSYTYDATGNRTGLTRHDPGGNTTKDVTTSQVFPPAGQRNQPTTAAGTGGGTGGAHALLSTTSTGPNNPGAGSYQYDATGNTTSVTETSGTTTMAWNPEGRLAALTKTGTAGGTSYVYDAAGNLLIRHDPGSSTLMLGTDELVLSGGAVTDSRTYDLPNGLTGVLQASGMTWQYADQHGTATVSLDAVTLTETRRPVDPFGVPRGTQPAQWAGGHGFVGGTQDDETGLTNLGAREYQPTTGRFLSPDPVLDAAVPQQWNGYAYSNNDPVNLSDPEGTDPPGTQGSCSYDLSLCDPAKGECDGVDYVPCGPQGDVSVGKGSTGKGKGGISIGTYSDGQPTLDGIRVPTRQELVWRYAARPDERYDKLLSKWFDQNCGGQTSATAWEKLCQDAHDVGIWGQTLPDPFGIGDIVNCATKGKDCVWAAVDVATLLIPGGGGAKAAEGAGRDAAKGAEAGAKAGAEAGASAARAESRLGQLAKLASCGANSFPGATPVLTADGTSKPIEDITVGDTVRATDPLTGETRSERVEAVIKTLTDTDFTDVTLSTGPGVRPLTSTQHHPYWDATTRRWTNAADLRTGDALRLPDGTTTRVLGVRNYTGHVVTYNLTVAELHTYYVLANGTPVLVHNAGKACWTIKGRLRAAGPGEEFGLPSRGRIRYVPPEGYNPANPLPRGPQKGYIDRFGNEWVPGPSRTAGHPFEWDVQLSRTGREKIGWLSRDGRHVNVDPNGEVTHQ